jgi:serpin B
MLHRIRRGWPIAAAVLAAARIAAAPDPAVRDAAQATSAFGLDLFQQLGAAKGNAVISPFSVSEALAVLSQGAAGETKSQMLHALHWTLPAGGLAAAFGARDGALNLASGGASTLASANGLWFQEGAPPLEPFLDAARGQFHAEIRPADFIHSSAAVGQEINAWVASSTDGKITGLFPAGVIRPDTRIVLANAVYFEGKWEHPFDPGRTEARPFYPAPGRTVQAPMMFESEDLKLRTLKGCDVLELPYAGGRLSMVILLPADRNGLDALERRLDEATLTTWLGMLDAGGRSSVRLFLPRFTMAFSAELTGALEAMGMAAAFRDGADFSALNGRRNLRVSSIYHKSWVKVDEEGTQAAAATGMAMVAFAVEASQPLVVDHPFLFLIRDNPTGTLLFLGRVADPTAG